MKISKIMKKHQLGVSLQRKILDKLMGKFDDLESDIEISFVTYSPNIFYVQIKRDNLQTKHIYSVEKILNKIDPNIGMNNDISCWGNSIDFTYSMVD